MYERTHAMVLWHAVQYYVIAHGGPKHQRIGFFMPSNGLTGIESAIVNCRPLVRSKNTLSIKDPGQFADPNAISESPSLAGRKVNGEDGKQIGEGYIGHSYGYSSTPTFNAGTLKKSTYRMTALGGKTYTQDTTAGNVKSVTTPSAPPKGKDADHVLEAQLVANTLQKAGYKSPSTFLDHPIRRLRTF
ncbi:hypothetical protein CPB84DRAFT_1823973 [Gymnopilus junonius]|uniref:Uncharacterized protein n=1 Tax=Gymnopilus junonius TaxID=109634 RepID=A0A9P5NQZ5_GYMJU|nr:hypothetical protein CPB84DRAFT_1823973 [Gymnopilus junonius]